MKVVAYGPVHLVPTVPDVLILELGGHVATVRVTGETSNTDPLDVESGLASGNLVALANPETYVDGSWMVIDTSGPKWISKSDLDAWKLKVSEDQIREGAADPSDRLSELEAAAALRSIDLQSLIKGLQSQSLPGESMADTFLRLRGRKP